MTEATVRSPAPSTSVSPSARLVWTRARGLLLALVVLVVAGVSIAALRSGGEHGRLDPRSADPYGSRAVAQLLEDRGVSVSRVDTAAEAAAASGPDRTLLVTAPDLLTERQQSALRAGMLDSGGRTVLAAPGPPSVGGLVPGVTADAPSATSTLEPDCSLPAADRAGNADTGGFRYSGGPLDAEACYISDDLPTLLRLPNDGGKSGGDTVLLGAPDILYNDRLDEHGNASLALQLLGSHPHLVWYLPSDADTANTEPGDRSFFDLIPTGWHWATLQLAVAAVLAALWRARRLGPLVTEHLPVVVRASETVEGRARLYRRADARERAAAALRAASRTRLAGLVGLSSGQAHTLEALLPPLTARLGSSGHEDLPALLFGLPPVDDDALIALADQLDTLEREVRTS